MLPMLAAKALSKKGGSSSVNSSTVKYLLIALGIAVSGVIGFFWWRNRKAQQQAALLQGDVFTQQASALRAAMDGPGTDEAEIFRIIPLITDFAKVALAYKNLTKGGNLEADLASELNTADYKKVMELLQYKGRTKGNTGAGSQSNVFIANHAGIASLPLGSDVYMVWQNAKGLIPQVFLYLSPERYPSSPVVRKRPANYAKKEVFGKVKGFKEITYGGSSTKLVLVNVITPNGQNFWVRQYDIAKVPATNVKQVLKGTDLHLIHFA